MFAAVAAMLPPAAALFALAAITLSCLRYGPLALALRQELAECETRRELRYTLVTIRVESDDAEVWRPVFRSAERLGNYQPIHRQARRPALRAAA